MADRLPMTDLTDERLGAALRELSAFVAVPTQTRSEVGDLARRARLRIEAQASGRGADPWSRPLRLPRLGRGLVFALIALLVVAVAAGAISLGLPGIRLVPAPSATASLPGRSSPPPSGALNATPTATATGPIGFDLGLGDPLAVATIPSSVDFPVILPPAETVGPPTSAWLFDGHLALVWRTSPALPETQTPGVGLILDEFRASLNPGYFEKIIDQGTTVSTVRVNGVDGYWISGQPHQIVYVNAQGDAVFDSRRSVGDTLLWARDGVTYRLETALGRDAAIALAESLR